MVSRNPLETNYEGNQEEKRKIDEAQYAFAFKKYLPPAVLVPPILEVETVTALSLSAGLL